MHCQVGKSYRVPCVQSQRFDGVLVPVIGPMHTDKELINFPWEHWHFDWRFMPTKPYNNYVAQLRGRSLSYLHGMVETDRHGGDEPPKPLARAVVWQFMKMLRDMPPFPPAPWQADLERAYAGARLTNCLTCPHRGLPLANLRPDGNGHVVCSGHGLRWNLRTGKLVREVVDIKDVQQLLQQAKKGR